MNILLSNYIKQAKVFAEINFHNLNSRFSSPHGSYTKALWKKVDGNYFST